MKQIPHPNIDEKAFTAFRCANIAQLSEEVQEVLGVYKNP